MSGNTETARQKSSSSERQKKTAKTQSVQLLPLMVKSATSAGLLLAVWGVGWMKFSLSWVIGASALYFVGKEFRKSNKAREEEAKAAEEPTLARVDELPSWVYFPDIERAEWLNKVVQQMWPFIGEHVAKTLRGFQSTINDKLPQYLQPFRFEDITLGDIPPRLGGVKVYIDNVKRDEIVLDAELSYLGDAEIMVSVHGIKAGIKDLLIHGTVRIILRPLINKMPLIGGFEFCFLSLPNLDFDFTNFANALDLPILNDSFRKIVIDQVSNIVVLPNFIRVDLCSEEDMTFSKKEIRMCEAVVKVMLVEADDLKRADAGKIFGKGKSDPYCKISVGGVTHSTKYKESTVRPRWDESFEFTVNSIQGQEIEINVYDHDDHVNDDFIGNTYIRIEELAKVGHMDEWIKLSNVKTGRIHVVATILYLTANADDAKRLKDTNGTTAVLYVSVDSAKDLASHSKGLVEPSPFVTLQLGHTTVKTTSRPKTTNPRWDESFHLMVTQPENEALNVQIQDASKNDELLGSIFFKLNKILTDEDMTLDRPFALEGIQSSCTVSMRLCLRFLTTTKPEPEEVQETTQPGLESSAPGGMEGGSVSKIPPATKSETETKPRYRGRQATIDGKHGRIHLTLRYNRENEKLIVTVHKCTNLIAYDKDHFSDPYVKMYLLPDRDLKRKTEVIKNNLNPVWEESYEWPLKRDDISSKTLEVMVKNFIGVFEKKTKTEMGIVNLKLADFDNLSQPVSDWFDLQDPESLLSDTTSFF